MSPADCGFAVVAGDPRAIHDASCRLGRVADRLDEHASSVASTAASLFPSWNGLAAGAYQGISNVIAEYFRAPRVRHAPHRSRSAAPAASSTAAAGKG